MVIYTEGNSIALELDKMTPAQRFIGVTDFDQILREIDCGNIPTNTGEPFPVNWKEDENQDPPAYGGPFNPWAMLK